MMKDYTVTGNRDVAILIEKYGLTYTQARRYLMREDGMSCAEIEGCRSFGPIINTIREAKLKINLFNM